MGFAVIIDEFGVNAKLLVHVGSFLFGDYRWSGLDSESGRGGWR